MIKLFRRWWGYLNAKLTGKFNEMADPTVQLEQALREAQDQHRRLKEQAANVIASQKQAELRLNKRMTDLESLNTNARQALIMAADAQKAGDAERAARMTSAAETIATQLIQVEKDVGDLKALVLQSTQASDQAKAAVQQNSRALQQKLAERSKLLSQLEQAKMQETINKAMASLNEAVGDDVPTLSEVRTKIEARYAKAKAVAELNESTVDASIREIEEATANAAAQDRLSELRDELGIAPGQAARRLAHGGARRARVRSARRASGLGEHHQVVAVDGLVGHVGREVPRALAGRASQDTGFGGRHPAGEDGAVASGDVERVTLVELTDHLDHAGRQQRRAPFDDGLAGAVVDDEVARGRAGERDPELASRQPPLVGRERRADAVDAGHGLGDDAGAVGAGDDRLDP